MRGTSPFYLAIYGLLIIGFAYFYTAIQFDPHRQADQIRKQGGFIPGIRPGSADRALPRQDPQPDHAARRPVHRRGGPDPGVHPGPGTRRRHDERRGTQLGFFGISILIAVGVALETMKQIDSQLMMRNYEGFLKS